MSVGTPTVRVRPLADTDYAVQAIGAGGSTTSATVRVTPVGAQGLSLSYVDPTPGAGDAVALKLASGGGTSVITLNLVAVQAIASLGAIALDLPLDGATAGSRDGSARVVLDAAAGSDVSPGFSVNTAKINPGSAPYSAAAALPTSGPLAGVLTLGAARKPSCSNGLNCAGASGSGDTSAAIGDVLATVRLKLAPAGGAGAIFAPAATASSGFRFTVRSGTAGAASAGTLAVGTLVAN
jgi:hypothetical protein